MEYLTKIETFAKKYDVLVFIVAHPTKMYKGNDGKIEEPTMYNIKGGGEWYDASYHGILVHRDYELRLLKLRYSKLSSKTSVRTELKLILLGNLDLALSYQMNRSEEGDGHCLGNKWFLKKQKGKSPGTILTLTQI